MYLRRATMEDARDLFRWKNDPVTRANSIVTGDLILWENHIEWLKRNLADPDVELYVITDGHVRYGDLRLNKDLETEISIRIDPEHRGNGIASLAVWMACQRFEGTLVAKVVEGNVASMRVFLANGFTLHSHRNGDVRAHYLFRRLA